MGKHKRQLTNWERDLIGLYKAQGLSHREISKAVGRDHRTIGRELGRNAWGDKYLPQMAGHLAALRKHKAGLRPLKMDDPEIHEYVLSRLKIKWSPEIISSLIREDKPHLSISHESIYKYVYRHAPELFEFLIHKHKFRRRKRRYCKRRDRIPNRLPISLRPDSANSRRRFGHFESDSMVSKLSKVGLNVIVERKSRYTMITKIEDHSPATTQNAIVKRLSVLPSSCRRTITYDNGMENIRHQQINNALGMNSFFCNAYHSWEKGTVENTNGLIRIFLPKRTDFKTVTDERIKEIENWLNDRPRKCLNFKTPRQYLFQLCGAIPP
jgi:IS30 family transposase